MKNLLIGLSVLSLIMSCNSTKKEESRKTEQSPISLEKVSTEDGFFSSKGETVTP